jgi:hypothetical protein
VRGTTVSGIGVEAEAGSAGTALQVKGRATFSRSGRLNVPAGFSGFGITGIHLTSSSLVLATVQNRIGVFVEAAVPNPAHSQFSIFLNKVVPPGKTAKVAWFIVN